MIIDVSHNNSLIDWEQVKPHIEGAILRVGYGNNDGNQDDRQYKRNLAECQRLGIPIDFYIYSYAKSVYEAESEAEHALRLALDGVIYFDSEQSGTQRMARVCAERFRDVIKSAGKKVGLYCSESWYNSYLKGIDGFDSLWIAKYGSNSGNQEQRPAVDCNLWQYTSRATIPGIAGYVDANVILKPIETPFVPPVKVDGGVYRLYNPNSGRHHFTINSDERDSLMRHGWDYEGVGWKAPKKGDIVYRMYNPNSGAHYFTLSATEVDNLVRAGWKREGTAFHSPKNGKPVYQLYNPNLGEHMYSISIREKDNLKSAGWDYEGVAFYGI